MNTVPRTPETLRDLLVMRGYSESEINEIVHELQTLMKAETTQRCFEMVPESVRDEIRQTPELLILTERHEELAKVLRFHLPEETMKHIAQEVFDSVIQDFIAYLKQTPSKQD